MPASCPASPALDQLADFARWEAELHTNPTETQSALVKRLCEVPDRRRDKGRRHPLVVILTLTACATLVVGSDSITAIWQWAARSCQDVLARLGARFDAFSGRYLVPSERTFRRVLADLNADALDTATCRYTADVVRRNTPAPRIPTTPGPVEREQRRVLHRTAEYPAPSGLLPADSTFFPGAAQVFRLRRDVGPLNGPWESKQIVFGVTSLPAKLAGPAQLAHYERAHWGAVESLHWIRDATFHDYPEVRIMPSPVLLASVCAGHRRGAR